ncbi:putative bifunctional diguanylate cyclase/phosphodiesterase [Methylocucumis oryzae]|uniref:putative bifunctional diguanylate cyclase/phosphodiesterase n=1 Tax=Methylocucumis oryzae TaxID=1632867 RepID=UPI00069797E9|nr:EAL domain-containing protein [Methylocucumis oryzae]
MLDLDHFKEVNDTLGHGMGDRLLRDAASRISSCVREADTVARLGGDEFTVILSSLDNEHDVNRVAECILHNLAKPFALEGEFAYISVSIGISFYPSDASTVEQLVKNADQAMYFAKQQGRNCYRFFTYDMELSAQNRLQLANDLYLALSKNQFQVHYQPIVDLRNGTVRKAEALIRWLHPERGIVEPNEFIPIAEEVGLIVEIGDWVFGTVVEQIQLWQQTLAKDFCISVNKSPAQINGKRHKGQDWLLHLTECGMAGDCLMVEVTEDLLMDTSSEVRERLLAYRNAGIQVAIDDFGTGYSSLPYLQQCGISFLKIDQSFVSRLSDNSSEQVLCEAIIVMAHKLGMTVIAEGIETEQQLALLVAANCDFGQGYYFAKPMSADALQAFVRELSPV